MNFIRIRVLIATRAGGMIIISYDGSLLNEPNWFSGKYSDFYLGVSKNSFESE